MNTFFAYLQQLELMAFFSGYPLLYAIVLFFFGNNQSKIHFKNRIPGLLPFSYAFTGTLYLGLQLKNFYFSYMSENVKHVIYHPYLLSWALLSILFWIPPLNRKKELSLIHSLVFFFFLVKNIILQYGSAADMSMLKNDMRIYTTSLLINAGAFLLVILISFMAARYKKI